MVVCTGPSDRGGGNSIRRLTLPESLKHWSLRSVQTKLIKMGVCLVRHARRVVFLQRISVGSSEVKRSNQGRGARLEEFEGGAYVVKATSDAHRTPVHVANGWSCELDGKVDDIRK